MDNVINSSLDSATAIWILVLCEESTLPRVQLSWAAQARIAEREEYECEKTRDNFRKN